MSQENVEVVRSCWAAFNRGDLEGALEAADPDVVTHRHEPEDATWHGPDGVLNALADWTAGFDHFELKVGDFIDAGDRVLALAHQTATGKLSGAPVEADFWFVFTVIEGRITEFDIFARKAEALEAAGLSE
jgi:ketosteroid isomerase-like protein